MQCVFIKSNRKRCQGNCVTGSEFCPIHAPENAKKFAAGRRKGGIERSKPAAVLPPDTPDAPLLTGSDVRAFVAETLNQVRTGRLAVPVGNCLFVGAGFLLKAIEESEIDRRLEALETRTAPVTGRAVR